MCGPRLYRNLRGSTVRACEDLDTAELKESCQPTIMALSTLVPDVIPRYDALFRHTYFRQVRAERPVYWAELEYNRRQLEKEDKSTQISHGVRLHWSLCGDADRACEDISIAELNRKGQPITTALSTLAPEERVADCQLIVTAQAEPGRSSVYVYLAGLDNQRQPEKEDESAQISEGVLGYFALLCNGLLEREGVHAPRPLASRCATMRSTARRGPAAVLAAENSKRTFVSGNETSACRTPELLRTASTREARVDELLSVQPTREYLVLEEQQMGFLDGRGPGPPPPKKEAGEDAAPLGAGRADIKLVETERADIGVEFLGGDGRAPNEAPDEQPELSGMPEGPHQGTSDVENGSNGEPETAAIPEPLANSLDRPFASDSDLSEGLMAERRADISPAARRQEHVVQNGLKHKKSREGVAPLRSRGVPLGRRAAEGAGRAHSLGGD